MLASTLLLGGKGDGQVDRTHTNKTTHWEFTGHVGKLIQPSLFVTGYVDLQTWGLAFTKFTLIKWASERFAQRLWDLKGVLIKQRPGTRKQERPFSAKSQN